jgi:hypothetical protein
MNVLAILRYLSDPPVRRQQEQVTDTSFHILSNALFAVGLLIIQIIQPHKRLYADLSGRSLPGIVGSNPAVGIDVCLL